MLSLCQGVHAPRFNRPGNRVFERLLLAQALFPEASQVLGDPNFIGTAANPLRSLILSAPIGSRAGTEWPRRYRPRYFRQVRPFSTSPIPATIASLASKYATQLVAGSVADLVIGQVDLFANQAQNPANGGRQAGLNNPTGLAVDSAGNLYVADSGNNRILRFPQPFNAANANQFPNLVIGQKSLATSTANLNGIGASTSPSAPATQAAPASPSIHQAISG